MRSAPGMESTLPEAATWACQEESKAPDRRPNACSLQETQEAGDEKFRRLCQAAFDGVLVHDGRVIVDANEKCSLMFRCSVSEIVGRSILDFTAPEMHERVLAHVTGRSDLPFESIGLRHDGERFPLQVCGISMDASPLRIVALRDVSDRKRCQQKERDREEKFRVLAQAAFDGIVVQMDGRITEANASFCAMYGYAGDEVIGMNIESFIPTEHRTRVLDLIRSGFSKPYESYGLRRDGTSFPTEVFGVTLPDGQRIVACRDISARRTAEQALIESEDRYRDIVDNCHDLICTHDLEGRILSVNPAASHALGIPPDVLCSMKIQDLLFPAAAGAFAQYVRDLKRDGIASGMMIVAAPNGRRRLWEYRNTLRIDGVTTPVVRGIARDVTEREDALHAVRKSEEHFRSIIENVSDVIAIVEPDGRLRYHSPSVERVLGYPANALADKPFYDLVHPTEAARAAEFLARQVADRDVIQTIELRLRHQNGAWRSFEIVAKNLVEGGRVSAVVANARDITDRKLLESQLAQANRLTSLGRLAATVAHEFNNVLMGMQPFAELMQRPDAEPAIVAKGAWHISNSIQRGKRIALDILRFTQPAEPVIAIVDVGEWWAKFAPEAEAVLGNMIRLDSMIPRGLSIVADKTQLSQVLANLVANARDAMPSGGILTVRAGVPAPNAVFPFGIVVRPDQFVQIAVGDSGSGMPPEVMDRAFEPLFTTKQSGGTGLGLAVAHQVIKQHGGHIFVESEPGEGTVFHLFIPIPKGSAVCAEPEKDESEDCGLETRKLLMVEDEPLIVEGIRALLAFSGIEVESVGSGAEATGAVDRFHPDVVLLDFGLPDMDGAEVYARIRKLHASLPVIFATGHGDRQAIQSELGDPRTRFLQKPFDVDTLLETIGELERSEVGR
jgi:two-component system cell cycle sensor histidine kinase/response regulator CckA